MQRLPEGISAPQKDRKKVVLIERQSFDVSPGISLNET